MSKRGSGSSMRISGFTARESKEINQVEALFRETDFYKMQAEQAKRAYGTIYDTSEKLAKSNVFVDGMEYQISKIAVFNDINPDFTDKQTNYIVKRMLKELGSDNPKWSPENVEVANPYVSGPARFNQSQVQKAADNTAQKRQNVNSFMKDVQKKSTANKKAAETKSLSSVLGSAMDRGALEVTFEGKTYYRARKNSKTWRVR